MNKVSKLIEDALNDLNVDVNRLYNPNPTTNPYIVYNQVTKSPNLFADDTEISRTFLVDVDIYTTDPSMIDYLSSEVEKRLIEVGFILKPSAGTIVENETEPIWYHEPLEFSYEKELK